MRTLVGRVLPGGAGSRTWAMLHQRLAEHVEDDSPAELRKMAPLFLGLLLGSPEFQQQ